MNGKARNHHRNIERLGVEARERDWRAFVFLLALAVEEVVAGLALMRGNEERGEEKILNLASGSRTDTDDPFHFRQVLQYVHT